MQKNRRQTEPTAISSRSLMDHLTENPSQYVTYEEVNEINQKKKDKIER